MRLERIIIGILIILHAVGIAALWLDVHPEFILLTPVNLVVTFGLVLACHRGSLRKVGAVLLTAFLVGFFAEVAGVNHGWLFGSYSYGAVLGPKYLNTPLMIGFNWAMLVYCSGVLVNALLPAGKWPLKASIGAAFMTGLDFLIEPVAITYDFWSWEGGAIPLRNYLDWFLVSLVLHGFFQWLLPNSKNKAGIALFLLQALFFLLIGLK